MRYRPTYVAALLFVVVASALAQESGRHRTLVIDTDLGVDDAVTLALALQSPDVDIVAISACEGVASGPTATVYLERLLALFNRGDIPLYAPATGDRPQIVPPFRPFAEAAVGTALPAGAQLCHKAFAASLYEHQAPATVLMLGPLTNLAAALRERPEIKERITEVVIAGETDVQQNWNLAYDRDATAVVKASGLRITCVAPSAALRKPESWRERLPGDGPVTSIGEGFVRRLLAEERVRAHYVTQWPGFSDELAYLYCVDSDRFERDRARGDCVPQAARSQELLSAFTTGLQDGRQAAPRVTLEGGPLPEAILRPDLRQRRAAILSKNGETEWFLELVASELHAQLEPHSVIGVKMGLRAAELLNAPRRAMKVVSHAAAVPPASYLNDGVLVASGATPGCGLFTHVPGGTSSTRVGFAYNGRQVVLRLKDEYCVKLAAQVERAKRRDGVASHDDMEGLRRVALDIWQDWHRCDLFETEAQPTKP